ncbi:hypothetical protein M0802_001498 [Mischocyttarus mexicanus]|nr:hypothetical protein M0802_001498 [Mischocyttarus mexicanus]
MKQLLVVGGCGDGEVKGEGFSSRACYALMLNLYMNNDNDYDDDDNDYDVGNDTTTTTMTATTTATTTTTMSAFDWQKADEDEAARTVITDVR